MAEDLSPWGPREDSEGDGPFEFHDKKVVGYLWKIHHMSMLMCNESRRSIYSPSCSCSNIPFVLEMYPKGLDGNSLDIFVNLHWKLEKEAEVNVRLVFYGSERVQLWSVTRMKQKVSKDLPLFLPNGPTLKQVHETDSKFLIDDGYLWIKCTVWKYDGPPELASIDRRYRSFEIKARTRMDQRLLVTH